MCHLSEETCMGHLRKGKVAYMAGVQKVSGLSEVWRGDRGWIILSLSLMVITEVGE